MSFNSLKKEELNITTPGGITLEKYAILENNGENYLQLKLINSSSKAISSFELYFISGDKLYSYLIDGSFQPNETFLSKNVIRIDGSNFEFLGFRNIIKNDLIENNSCITINELYKGLSNDDDVINHINDLLLKERESKSKISLLNSKINDTSKDNEKTREKIASIESTQGCHIGEEAQIDKNNLKLEKEIKILEDKLAKLENDESHFGDSGLPKLIVYSPEYNIIDNLMLLLSAVLSTILMIMLIIILVKK